MLGLKANNQKQNPKWILETGVLGQDFKIHKEFFPFSLFEPQCSGTGTKTHTRKYPI